MNKQQTEAKQLSTHKAKVSFTEKWNKLMLKTRKKVSSSTVFLFQAKDCLKKLE